MTRRAKAVLATALLILGAAPTPASAQFPAPRGTNVDQLIARAKGKDFLVGETSADGKRLIVRHPASALACRFPSDGAQNLLITQYPPRERGQDIACSWLENDIGITIWASPAEGRTAAQALATEIQDRLDLYSGNKRDETASPGGLPEGVVEGGFANEDLLYKLTAFESRGWVILLTVAYHRSKAEEAKPLGDWLLTGLVTDAHAAH